jgi:Secretion system C-terminal sorting domain
MTLKNFTLFTAVLLSTKLFSQTPLPYFTGFDNTAQKAGWQEFRKGSTSNGGWDYPSAAPFSSPNALSHGFPLGGSSPTNDWFVSPAFNFSNGGKIDSIRHLFSGFGSPGESDTIAIYLLTGSPDPALASSKVLLYDYKTKYMSTNNWELDSPITIPSKSGSSYIAFKYSTTQNWLDVNFDNIRISGKANTALNNIATAQSFRVYPNPASNYAELIFPDNTSAIEIYNNCGQLMYQEITNGLINTNVSLHAFENGLYHIHFITPSGFSFKNLMVVK